MWPMWPMDNGQWTMNNEQCGQCGQWPMANGQLPMNNENEQCGQSDQCGQWTMANVANEQ